MKGESIEVVILPESHAQGDDMGNAGSGDPQRIMQKGAASAIFDFGPNFGATVAFSPARLPRLGQRLPEVVLLQCAKNRC